MVGKWQILVDFSLHAAMAWRAADSKSSPTPSPICRSAATATTPHFSLKLLMTAQSACPQSATATASALSLDPRDEATPIMRRFESMAIAPHADAARRRRPSSARRSAVSSVLVGAGADPSSTHMGMAATPFPPGCMPICLSPGPGPDGHRNPPNCACAVPSALSNAQANTIFNDLFFMSTP